MLSSSLTIRATVQQSTRNKIRNLLWYYKMGELTLKTSSFRITNLYLIVQLIPSWLVAEGPTNINKYHSNLSWVMPEIDLESLRMIARLETNIPRLNPCKINKWLEAQIMSNKRQEIILSIMVDLKTNYKVSTWSRLWQISIPFNIRYNLSMSSQSLINLTASAIWDTGSIIMSLIGAKGFMFWIPHIHRISWTLLSLLLVG